jgi:site-specific recombinase XerD
MTSSTLLHLARLYVSERRASGDLAAVTAPTVAWTLRDFAAFVGPVPLSTLSAEHVERYLASISVARSTARARFSQLRTFGRWLKRRGYIAVDLTEGLRAPRQPRAVPRAYHQDAVRRLLEVCPDSRARLICLLEVQEGLRACEVSRLEVGDIDFAEQLMLVRGKGGRERILPLSTQTWHALSVYLTERPAHAGPLIRSFDHPWRGISPPYIAHMVSGWLRTVGVRGGGHGLRHTMATDLLRQGVDVRTIQQALGHATLTSTQIYLPFMDVARLRSAMDGRWYGAPSAS